MIIRFKPISALLLFFFLFTGTTLTYAQTTLITSSGTIESSSWINWQTATFMLEVSFEADKTDLPLSMLRSRSEKVIEQHLPQLFVHAVSTLLIDSRSSIADKLIESPEKTAEFRKIATEGSIKSSRFTPDFSKFQRVFQYRLYPTFSRQFINHQRPMAQTIELDYVPSGQYSGIVIYVDNPIEIYGSHTMGTPQPALFPRIYDMDMNVLIDARMIDPEAINRHGMVNYYHTSEIQQIHDKVGEIPLYVHAQALFGIHSTDLVLPDRAAKKLKADSHTLSLITQGRIAIVSSFDLSNSNF